MRLEQGGVSGPSRSVFPWAWIRHLYTPDKASAGRDALGSPLVHTPSLVGFSSRAERTSLTQDNLYFPPLVDGGRQLRSSIISGCLGSVPVYVCCWCDD